jgi:hypothetical protein
MRSDCRTWISAPNGAGTWAHRAALLDSQRRLRPCRTTRRPSYGTEAQTVMRIEKGHVAGPELNGQTSAADLGLARMMSQKRSSSAVRCPSARV